MWPGRFCSIESFCTERQGCEDKTFVIERAGGINKTEIAGDRRRGD